jgi:hypothetical protein
VFELAGAFSGKGVLRLNEVAERLRGDPRVSSSISFPGRTEARTDLLAVTSCG